MLLGCYLPLHKIQNTNTMTVWKWKNEVFFLKGLVNVIVYLDDFRSEEEIRNCVRCLMSELFDGMVNANVGNVKELYCDFKVGTMNVRENRRSNQEWTIHRHW